MVLRPRRRWAIAGFVTVLALLILGGAALTLLWQPSPAPPPSGSLRVYRPSQPQPPWIVRVLGERLTGRAAPLPMPIPCGPSFPGAVYAPIQSGGPAPHPTGVAFARYPNPPGLAEVAYVTASPPGPGVAYIAILADLRYDVAGKTINVTTCEPSPEIAQQEISLGNAEVALGGNRIGFLANVGGNPPPVLIRFVEGPLVIEVSSTDPAADVVGVARAVVVSK